MADETSIYRRHAALVYAVAGPADRSNADEPVAPDAPVDFTRRRKASPVACLLPSTRKWLDALPRRVQPHSLCESYPRIANLIAATWGDAEGLNAYFEELLIDRRGSRRGFTPEVANDLRALRLYHAAL
jgi:hypothetical protein